MPVPLPARHYQPLNLEAQPVLQYSKKCKVAVWAPVTDEAKSAGNQMVWDMVENWRKRKGGKIVLLTLDTPTLIGVKPYPEHADT